MINCKTISSVDKGRCTGCGACYNKCPVGAIKMLSDEEGFEFPYIDQSSCIKCGLCFKICPAIDESTLNNEAKIYAVMDNDIERMKSSSGGMFGILARKILSNHGIVCGASYTEDYMSVRHMIISQIDQLEQLQGSKYVQSSIGKCYEMIEKSLKEGKQVLFSGTPCQVDGLKHFLHKEYDSLFLVDIICHGVPSPLVYKKYILEKKPGNRLEKVDFREKAFWGWGTASSIFAGGQVYRNDCYKDAYWRAFLGGMSTRKCCGECKYASMSRCGDITIGDFWGIRDIDPELDDGKGTSLVQVNTSKGDELFCDVINSALRYKEIDSTQVFECAKKHNGQLVAPKKSHWARERFFKLVNSKSVTESYEWAEKNCYDVGITGWWYNENYGGTITYYALNRVLEKMGLSVLMISKCSDNPNYRPKRDSIPYRFALKHYNMSKNYSHKNIHILNDHCKAFVSGSDQLFNPYLWEYSGPQYFLDYVTGKNRIISYASSFGNIREIPEQFKMQFSYLLHRFDFFSVREDYAVKLCEDTFGITPQRVLDPVFLCDVEEYDKLADSSGLKEDKPYLLSFFLDPNNDKREAVLYLCEKFKMPSINLLNATDFESNMRKLSLDNMKPNIDIEEWIYYYKNASFVITDSFHGTCFAIIFKKPFISVANMQRGERRFVSMLEEVGLIQYLIYDLQDIRNNDMLYLKIDYEEIQDRLDALKETSLKWLENALKGKQDAAKNIFKLLDNELCDVKKMIKMLKNN